ncbi:MAG: NYN domain-containing protein [Acidobacteria bacterium]|nr:NYN domain-containing protein [Acidobacteriota bacterium]
MADAVLLADAENIRPLKEAVELLALTTRVRFVIRRAFAYWSNQPRNLKRAAFDLAFDLFDAGFGPHRAEVTLGNHALQICEYLPEVTTHVLLCGDGALEPVVKRLRQLERFVIIAGHEGSTSRALKAAAHLYVAIPGHAKARSKTQQARSKRPHTGLAEDLPAPVAVNMPEGNGNDRHVLDLVHDRPDYMAKMTLRGLPLSEVANVIRPLGKFDTSQRRWLKKFLLEACDGSPFCLARSKVHGDHRLFRRDFVPTGEFVITSPD